MKWHELDEFTQQYVETALWSSTDFECRCHEGKIEQLETRKGELDRYGRERMPLGMCAELDQVNAELSALEHEDDCGRETGGMPLDENYGIEDIDEKTLAAMAADCADFQEYNAALLADYDLGTAGHDFWLTRNGHGAGFWDGDYDTKDGEALTKASKVYGSVNLYTHNGKVWGGL